MQTSPKLSPKKLGTLPCCACRASAVLTAQPGGFLFSLHFTLCRQLPCRACHQGNVTRNCRENRFISFEKLQKLWFCPHTSICWREKLDWKNRCLFLTCPNNDFASSSSLDCVYGLEMHDCSKGQGRGRCSGETVVLLLRCAWTASLIYSPEFYFPPWHMTLPSVVLIS